MSSSLRRSSRRKRKLSLKKTEEEQNEPPRKARRLDTAKKKKIDNANTSTKKKTPTRRSLRKHKEKQIPDNIEQNEEMNFTTEKKTTRKRPIRTHKKIEMSNNIEQNEEKNDQYVSRSGKVEPSKKKISPYDRKIPSTNQHIADKFHELAELEKLNLNISRSAQARRTARAIEATLQKIENGKQAQDTIPRVGKKSAQQIDEILKTGTINRIEELKSRKTWHKDEGVNKRGINENLACLFEELAAYEFDDGDTSRGAMFRLMGKKLRTMKTKITSGEQLQHYRGFGPSAKEIVDEYLKTGHSTRLDNFRKAYGNPRKNLKMLYNRQKNWKAEGKYD